ncbi:MAG TPA: hypothetical protein VGN72_01330 [Tepidisphaeraceae bacterium]|jgi:ABC-type amino acid transport substrate-binding protein|nr:hypothetical protein [Tepidisphaeraceae bacterium]
MIRQLKRAFPSLSLVALGVAVSAGCSSPTKQYTRMYDMRSPSDYTFVQEVLQNEQDKYGTTAEAQLGKDRVATVTTTYRAHQELARSLNVRSSDQWPYNWRETD